MNIPRDKMNEFKKDTERFQPQESRPVLSAFGPPDFGEEPDIDSDYEALLEEPMDDSEEPHDDYAEDELQPRESARRQAFERDEEVEYPTPPSFRQEGGGFLRDEEIFPGGPTRTEVASWKKQFEQDGHAVNLTDVGGDIFIWRTMSRTEYREIMTLQNIDPLQREEIICEITMLFPYEYNFSSMANRKAGVPAILAEQIMHESGFKKIAPPIRL